MRQRVPKLFDKAAIQRITESLQGAASFEDVKTQIQIVPVVYSIYRSDRPSYHKSLDFIDDVRTLLNKLDRKLAGLDEETQVVLDAIISDNGVTVAQLRKAAKSAAASIKAYDTKRPPAPKSARGPKPDKAKDRVISYLIERYEILTGRRVTKTRGGKFITFALAVFEQLGETTVDKDGNTEMIGLYERFRKVLADRP